MFMVVAVVVVVGYMVGCVVRAMQSKKAVEVSESMNCVSRVENEFREFVAKWDEDDAWYFEGLTAAQYAAHKEKFDALYEELQERRSCNNRSEADRDADDFSYDLPF